MTLTAEQIPDDVVGALRAALEKSEYLDAAIAAALSAWPRAKEKPYWDFKTHERHSELILPLPKRSRP